MSFIEAMQERSKLNRLDENRWFSVIASLIEITAEAGEYETAVVIPSLSLLYTLKEDLEELGFDVTIIDSSLYIIWRPQ